MAQGNTHFTHLKREYIFPIIEKKLSDLVASCPEANILNLGIGDVSLPLAPSIAHAIQTATQEMTTKLYGYGPSQGQLFLREKIRAEHYPQFSCEEIFISDGINTDIFAVLDLFHPSCRVAIPTPAYPAYLDSNLIAGRKNRISKMPCTESSGFVPEPPDHRVDIVYLCSPHNPTGVAMTKDQLSAFVSYAQQQGAILLYDNAYEAFITSPNIPRSIYEISGAEEVAIEFRSFSKSAGFTGLRCSYYTLPKQVTALFGKKRMSLHPLWTKRQSIKYNGASYPIQKGAEACFSPEGKQETKQQVKYYLEQTQFLKKGLQKSGFTCFGGVDAPYIWWKTPHNLSSWEFFDLLLQKCHLISIPGCGFGEHGEGFIRISGFTTQKIAEQALQQISTQLL
jgi:LL-diaminopimelate aminotransferase